MTDHQDLEKNPTELNRHISFFNFFSQIVKTKIKALCYFSVF